MVRATDSVIADFEREVSCVNRAEADIIPTVSSRHQRSPEGALLLTTVEAVEEFPFITGLLRTLAEDENIADVWCGFCPSAS
jgi:hypothetical protein